VKNKIHQLFASTKNSIALLIDPEKAMNQMNFEDFSRKIDSSKIDFLLIGGSTANRAELNNTINLLKTHCKKPIIIFPGSPDQISEKADALLFLSLISGRNPDYLIESQIESAIEIYNLNLECIPTSYLLIDGLTESAVAKVSKTEPIPIENPDLIYKTALAGKLLGHSVTYLEAGSGAKRSVPVEIAKKISTLDTILIIGGGIKSISQIEEFHKAGTDVVVIGNHLENNPEFLNEINNYKTQSLLN
jgi:putative glycerol-1-phosphate prenyltransferase